MIYYYNIKTNIVVNETLVKKVSIIHGTNCIKIIPNEVYQMILNQFHNIKCARYYDENFDILSIVVLKDEKPMRRIMFNEYHIIVNTDNDRMTIKYEEYRNPEQLLST